jgi:hypothetical protein
MGWNLIHSKADTLWNKAELRENEKILIAFSVALAITYAIDTMLPEQKSEHQQMK